MQFSLALLAGAAMVAAQIPSSLPACGQTCVSNMLAIAASDFGCATGNTTCYCSDPRFGYGLRDCSLQACGEAVYSSVLAYGTSVCSGLGITSTAAASAITAPTSGAGANTTAAAGSSSTPYSTSAILTTISSGDTPVATSTIGSSTLYHPVGGVVGGAATSAISSAASAASSLASSVSSVASSAASKASSAANGASSAASSATSSGFAAQMTAAPILGGAALAALLMI